MQDQQRLIRRLSLTGKPMSKGQKRIAEFIAAHPEKAGSMTAAMLGSQCDVSESTVVRFAVAMGYEGYPELQEKLRSLVRQQLTAEQRFDLTGSMAPDEVLPTVLKNDLQNMRKTMEELSPEDFRLAVDALLSARRIYVMGLRSSAPLAQFLYHYLHQILDDVTLVQNTTGDVLEDIERIGPEDVLFSISFPRYSSRTLECVRFARQNGAKIIGMTDGEMSPLKELSHLCLLARTEMIGFVDSLAAPLSLINALVIAIGMNRRGELEEHFKRLEGIWNAHSVYIDNAHE